MQALIFNSTERTVKLYKDVHVTDRLTSDLLYEFNNIPTVKVMDGCYEVMQEENSLRFPVLRVPIANTNMIIIK